MDMSQYRGLFVSESKGHIQVFNDLIIRLENTEADPGAIDELFRHAHSLKGMAATMQYQAIADLAHSMENLLSRVRSNEISFSAACADILLEGSDLLTGMVSAIEAGSDQLPDVADLVRRLNSFTGSDTCPQSPIQASVDAEPSTDDTSPKPREYQPRRTDSFTSVRVKTETLDRLVDITGELITTRYRLADRALFTDHAQLEEPLNRLSTLLRELRDEVFLARMLPFSVVAERLPRLVRDLSRKQGKEIQLQIEGMEIELDRAILEGISEPLVHILRNAVDHGMETPENRISVGKPPNGLVRITVSRDKDFVELRIADDGRGMDPVRIAGKAVEMGLLSREQASVCLPQEAFMLVCMPGFSTAATVTDVSGRGVGMDAVSTALHALGGSLAIDSELGKGTVFSLKVPISVSIIHALLVECGRMTIGLPVNIVQRTLELGRDEIVTKQGGKAFSLDGEQVPLKSLNNILGQPVPPASRTTVPAVVIESGGMITVLETDRLLGQREIFVKPMGAPLNRIRGLTGGSITGDGHLVYVMDATRFA